MNPAWQSLLEQSGARMGTAAADGGVSLDPIADFGDAAAELAAAQTGTVIVPLAQYGLMRASGEEAVGFLQNLTSNDVKKLDEGHAQFNSFNSAKGRVQATFLIWRDGADYLVQTSADIRPAIQKKLSMYILRTKVKLSDAEAELAVFGIAGPQAADLVASLGGSAPTDVMAVARLAAGTVVKLGEQRFIIAITADAAVAAWPQLTQSARPAGTPVWRWLDIVSGTPRVTQATQDHFVPQMANLDLIDGISFTKGCYPGQEIVARTRYLGKLKRRMYLGNSSAAAAAGTPVYAPETGTQACGMVVDAAPAPAGGFDVLAVIQMSCADAGQIHLGDAAGPALALRPLPYAMGE